MVKRVVLDTNVYGELVSSGLAGPFIRRLLDFQKTLRIYGIMEVREELRSVPHILRIGKQNFRIAVLEAYDSITGGRTLANLPGAEKLAREYYSAYRRFGGNCSWRELSTDFSIVAKATLHGIDIVTSDDRRTMQSSAALAAYAAVNKERGTISPFFYSFREFAALLL